MGPLRCKKSNTKEKALSDLIMKLSAFDQIAGAFRPSPYHGGYNSMCGQTSNVQDIAFLGRGLSIRVGAVRLTS